MSGYQGFNVAEHQFKRVTLKEANRIYKEGGSGIGLSISRQIMRLSGGSIALRSNPSQRQTTFVLTFP